MSMPALSPSDWNDATGESVITVVSSISAIEVSLLRHRQHHTGRAPSIAGAWRCGWPRIGRKVSERLPRGPANIAINPLPKRRHHENITRWIQQGGPTIMADIRPIAPSIPPRRRRSYARPTLIKGPVLASVTAVKGGGAVSGVAPPPPACWVARAAFGEADIRWMIFQAWLIEDAPAWIRAGYLRY